MAVFLGMGYHRCHTPTVILRNLIENPGWYTSYTPYQAEISQGRLEALLTFQTMVQDLTAMEIPTLSLLDEATAAAEAMAMVARSKMKRTQKRCIDQKVLDFQSDVIPILISVVQVRAEPMGVEAIVVDHKSATFDEDTIGIFYSILRPTERQCLFVDRHSQRKPLVRWLSWRRI